MHTEFTRSLFTIVHPQLMGVHRTGERKDGNNNNVHWRMVQMFLGALSESQHCSVLRLTYCKIFEHNCRSSTPGLGNPQLDETQHYNVLCEIFCKTFEQQWKVVHTGVGQPLHLMKLNTITCCVRLIAKHSSNDGRSSTPWEMCNVHAEECCGVGLKGWSLMPVIQSMTL